MSRVVSELQRMGFRLASVYLIDSTFLQDAPKFVAGVLACLSAMTMLELPHCNVRSSAPGIARDAALLAASGSRAGVASRCSQSATCCPTAACSTSCSTRTRRCRALEARRVRPLLAASSSRLRL